jgi:broad specificity phosphatase PhoE
LTDVGRAQARALGERWHQIGVAFDLIVSSPLVRGLETAEIIVRLVGARVETDSIWMEHSTGEMTGLTWAEAFEGLRDPQFRTRYDAFGKRGEGDWELFLRAGTAVPACQDGLPASTIVTHGGLLDKTLCAILGIPVQTNSNGLNFRFESSGYAAFNYLPGCEQRRMLQLAAPIQGI